MSLLVHFYHPTWCYCKFWISCFNIVAIYPTVRGSLTGFLQWQPFGSNIDIVWRMCNKFHGTKISHQFGIRIYFIPVNICSPRKSTMATSKSFSSVAWNCNIWNTLQNYLPSIPTLPAIENQISSKHHSLWYSTNYKLSSHSLEIPYCPAKGVPPERLRLVKGIYFA